MNHLSHIIKELTKFKALINFSFEIGREYQEFAAMIAIQRQLKASKILSTVG